MFNKKYKDRIKELEDEIANLIRSSITDDIMSIIGKMSADKKLEEKIFNLLLEVSNLSALYLNEFREHNNLKDGDRLPSRTLRALDEKRSNLNALHQEICRRQ